MNLPRLTLAAALALATGLSVVPAQSAHAQSAPAAGELGGSPVAGVCMLSREAVFAQSKVGKAASERLGQLAEQARNTLSNQRKPLDTDIQSFQQKASTLTEDQRKQQGAALQQRMQTFQSQASEQNERIQLTRAKVMQRIGQEAQPVVAASYTKHRCGLLLNRDAVLGGNTTNDLTSDVVQGLDAKLTTISFNLEPLPAQGASNGGAK
ncbi:OmpH family outer membrane protein [Rhodanobacter lindaniclasticus]|uniref:Molecular chaperone Skp n=1 Tax=Rhodanobacter lindaniclasticus TaxID=75310 RepID=A0A4S3KFT9_9GAMM|nr:OmpH family outer membrane protein [Rhodanobacter lindaniclasticus]THD06814.1 molecular chaperone Skp [Rhodanobacter lindaniclasticus]